MSQLAPVQGNPSKFTSVDNPIVNVPVRYKLATSLGLFKPKYHRTNTFNIEIIDYVDSVAKPVRWGTSAKNVQGESKGYLPLVIPHYAEHDAVTPEDIDGNYVWEQVLPKDNGNRPEDVTSVFERKMRNIKQALVRGQDAAFNMLIKSGTAYTDENLNTVDYFTEFGVVQKTVDFYLNDDSADPMLPIREATDHIKANAKNGQIPSRFVAIAHSGFFDKLERHPYTIDSFKYFAQSQSVEVLNQALGTQGLPIQDYYTVLRMGDVTFVRVTDTSEMVQDEVRIFPIDVDDLFEVHFAPTKSTFTPNALAQSIYYREQAVDDIDQPQIRMVAESNYLPVLRYPALLVKGVIGS